MRKKILWTVVALRVALVILFYAGPKVEVDTTLRPLELPDDLEGYLRASEAKFSDIVPGAEKTIIWGRISGGGALAGAVVKRGMMACEWAKRTKTFEVCPLAAAKWLQ